jgi:hypothetical protein
LGIPGNVGQEPTVSGEHLISDNTQENQLPGFFQGGRKDLDRTALWSRDSGRDQRLYSPGCSPWVMIFLWGSVLDRHTEGLSTVQGNAHDEQKLSPI